MSDDDDALFTEVKHLYSKRILFVINTFSAVALTLQVISLESNRKRKIKVS